MKVYIVRYGLDHPDSVDSVWTTEAKADQRDRDLSGFSTSVEVRNLDPADLKPGLACNWEPE